MAAGFGDRLAAAGLAAGFATAGRGCGAGLALRDGRRGFFAGAAFLAESAFFAMVFLAFVAFAGFLAAILGASRAQSERRAVADSRSQRGARLYRRRFAGTGQRKQVPTPLNASTRLRTGFTYTTARQRNRSYTLTTHRLVYDARCDSIRSSWPVSSPSSIRPPSISPAI